MRGALRRGRASRLHEALTAFAILFVLAVVADRLNGGPENAQKDAGGTRQFSGAFTVIDGDTLSIRGERLRLSGVDAPEMAQTCVRSQGVAWPCGREAKRVLQDLMKTTPALCSGAARDRYHGLLVTCRAGSAVVNAEMVRRGMAVSYGGYMREERQARADKAGMWAGTFERPQDWRRHHGDAEDAATGWLEGLLKTIGVAP